MHGSMALVLVAERVERASSRRARLAPSGRDTQFTRRPATSRGGERAALGEIIGKNSYICICDTDVPSAPCHFSLASFPYRGRRRRRRSGRAGVAIPLAARPLIASTHFGRSNSRTRPGWHIKFPLPLFRTAPFLRRALEI